MDASTMIAMSTGKGRTQFCVVRKTPFDASGELKIGACRAMKLEKPLTTIRYQLDLNVFVKWNQMQNGSGDFGPVTLIVAVPGLLPGEFYCAEVKGVTNGIDKTAAGYVYFANTRCMSAGPDAVANQDAEEGNVITVVEAVQLDRSPSNSVGVQSTAAEVIAPVIAPQTANIAVAAEVITPPTANIAKPTSSKDCAMTPWEHLLTTIMIPTVRGYGDRYDMRDPTGELYHSQVAIDGELVILKETQKPAVQQALRGNQIGMVKGRASGTEFDNACGMYIYFNQPISCRTTVTPIQRCRRHLSRQKHRLAKA